MRLQTWEGFLEENEERMKLKERSIMFGFDHVWIMYLLRNGKDFTTNKFMEQCRAFDLLLGQVEEQPQY